MSDPIYAIGDVHGQHEMLLAALEQVEIDGGPDAKVVFLGDYVDRGANSDQVIQLLINGIAAGKNWTCLLGNHDRMFSMFMEDVPRADPHLLVGYHWFHDRIGGVETMLSYGVEIAERERTSALHERARKAVPNEHLDFLKSLKTHEVAGEQLFVHAGIRPGVPLPQQIENDLVWIREEFLTYSEDHPWLVVHGHTAIDQATHYGNRVNLDSGAGYGKPLSTAVFEGAECWLLGDNGRTALAP